MKFVERRPPNFGVGATAGSVQEIFLHFLSYFACGASANRNGLQVCQDGLHLFQLNPFIYKWLNVEGMVWHARDH